MCQVVSANDGFGGMHVIRSRPAPREAKQIDMSAELRKYDHQAGEEPFVEDNIGESRARETAVNGTPNQV